MGRYKAKAFEGFQALFGWALFVAFGSFLSYAMNKQQWDDKSKRKKFIMRILIAYFGGILLYSLFQIDDIYRFFKNLGKSVSM